MLTRIILGARISFDAEEKINSLRSELKASPDITKAQLSEQEYKIIID